MSKSKPHSPVAVPGLSAAGLSHLGGLLSALDLLDPILQLPSTVDPDRPRLVFGRFQLVRRLGAGRFGIVLLAEDPDLRRTVVVKVPQPAVLTDPTARERFVREARSAARLDHPGIVPVFEAGERSGLPFLVAGYVAGLTLGEWVRTRGGSTSVRSTVQMLVQLTAAIQHAHDRGVLHCDLSPSNILLDQSTPPDPKPVITDFGLARLLEDDPTLTRTFQVAGTPLYMAPEQALGDRRSLTAQTDIYSLGVILYELLTGQPPFASESIDRLLVQVIHAPPTPPRRVRPEIPKDLEAVCLKCLEKRPENRYRSADALVEDLNRYLTHRPTLARPVGLLGELTRTVLRRPGIVALLALTFAAVSALPAVAIWTTDRLSQESQARQSAEADASRDRELAQASEFLSTLERIRSRRLEKPPGWAAQNEADLRTLAEFPYAQRLQPELRTEAAAALAAVDLRLVRILAEQFLAYAPAFSPDGSTLALCGWRTRDDGCGVVRLVDPTTGNLRRELTFPIDPQWTRQQQAGDGGRSVAFSPDGQWLVVGTRGGQIARWNLAEPHPVPIVWTAHTHDRPNPRDDWVMVLAFSTDGQRLYSACRGATRIWDVAQNWTPIGDRLSLVVSSGQPTLHQPILAHRIRDQIHWDLIEIDTQGLMIRSTEIGVPDVFTQSRSGRLAAGLCPPHHELGLIHLGRSPRVWPFRADDQSDSLQINAMAFTSDNRLLVTAEEMENRIKLWDVATGILMADHVLVGGSLRFALSPDDRYLAVTAENQTRLYEITGSVRETLAISGPRHTNPIAVRPDGQALLVVQCEPNQPYDWSIWDVPSGRPGTRRFSRSDFRLTGRHPVADYSPVGDLAAFAVSNSLEHTFRPGIRIEITDGTTIPAEDVQDLRFGPDGRLWAADAHRVRVWSPPAWQESIVWSNDVQARTAGQVVRAVAPGRTITMIGRRDGQVAELGRPGSTPQLQDSGLASIVSMALSPDETQILLGGEEGHLAILHRSTGHRRMLTNAHRDVVRSVAFGPDGWFASGSADRTIKIWNQTGDPIITLSHPSGVRKIALSADGTLLTVQVDSERGVRRWRLDQLRASLRSLGLSPWSDR